MNECIFCDMKREAIYENDRCYAIYDAYPVNPGHALIIPKRHIETYFEATAEEVLSFHKALHAVKRMVDSRYAPDGYNIGINVHEAAGQSVFHLHIHLIPRYDKDVEDPRGGVRGVIPDKRGY